MVKRIICLIMALCLTLCVSGCGTTVNSENLLENIEKQSLLPSIIDFTSQEAIDLIDFSVNLFRQSLDDKNDTLISPLSVIYALAMTANGAKNETLSQFEETFGMSINTLNEYLYSYSEKLIEKEEAKLNIANSVWFRDDENRLNVKEDFLQNITNYYDSGIFKAPFDKSTLKDINNWVKENTNGMIKEILNDISADNIMFLINAISFEAEWTSIYEDNQVRDGYFTKEDGTKQDVELMYSTEHCYIYDDLAEGFIKYYSGGDFAFAALLPNEDTNISSYISSLTGEKLISMLTKKDRYGYIVNAAIPKFESEFEIEISSILSSLGISDAFNSIEADFSDMAKSSNGNIYINQVLHKAFISVAEKGTRAGAATAVEVNDSAAEIITSHIKTIHLDRPFIYMIIDLETNIPIFIGTVMDV